ncbi:MAG: (2Fe-2S)-binding protein [Polyangiaceae bacterium]|nr:(2Fe-2S)-binding protein [Polyangiaceae bacterium]
MPTIELEGNDLGPPVSAHAPAGGRVLDACDDARAPVAFSCRAATCGTCRVDVLAGAHLLAPPADDERDLLERLGAAPAQRLACQAIALPGAGLIRLRWVRAQ